MKELAYYESLPYRAVWERGATADGDWYWEVHLQEIPAVVGLGATESEALEELRERFAEYVCFHIDEGLDIPEPAAGALPETRNAD
jgi:predicted RNase H-like HicB family nuclease